MSDFETHPAGTAARIAGKTIADWIEFARRDDCLDYMVPSDLRQVISALTRANAATAAAYEVAARAVAEAHVFAENDTDGETAAKVIALGRAGKSIRALATPDQTAALDKLIAEAKADALSGPWDDKPDAMTATVEASYPHLTKDYDTYTQALELVSARHSKGALVALVNHLLAASKKGGV